MFADPLEAWLYERLHASLAPQIRVVARRLRRQLEASAALTSASRVGSACDTQLLELGATHVYLRTVPDPARHPARRESD